AGEELALEDEVAGADPARGVDRLLLEAGHLPAVNLDLAEPPRRPYRRYRTDPTVLAMETEQVVDVNIAHAVAVGEHERLTLDVALDALDAATGHGVDARLG